EAIERLATAERWLIWVSVATPLPPWDVPESFLRRYFLAGTSLDDEEEDEEPAEPEEPLEPLPHPPLGPIDREDDTLFLRLQGSYCGAVEYLDSGLGLLFEHLRERGLLDGLTVVVTGDHGLPLGEHGVVGNERPWLHDELTHVPLLVRL